jgi:hypothetical protein
VTDDTVGASEFRQNRQQNPGPLSRRRWQINRIELETTMALSLNPRPAGMPALPRLPSVEGKSWPLLVIIAIMLAGVLSPLFCIAGAVGALAFAERDQAALLMGASLMHVVIRLTLF